MKEKVLEVLKSVRSDVDYENEKEMIDGGVLDSFDIISIVSELNDTFDIEISVDELEPENFNTLEAIVALVESLS
jgi:acyl carrier protein